MVRTFDLVWLRVRSGCSRADADGLNLDEVSGTAVLPDHVVLSTVSGVASHRVFCPCDRSGNICLSRIFAAVAATEWVSLIRLVTEREVFMPTYHPCLYFGLLVKAFVPRDRD